VLEDKASLVKGFAVCALGVSFPTGTVQRLDILFRYAHKISQTVLTNF